MQSSLIPVKIIQQTPANLGTADLKFIGLADDSHQYALKRLADHPMLPISEWIGYHLSRAIGIATPDFAAVWLDDQTPAFGSRIDETVHQLGLPPNPVQVAQFLGPDMRNATEPIFAVDAFLPNDDRHARNFLWRITATGAVPLAFDFSRAWLIGGLPFGKFPLRDEDATIQVWKYLKSTFLYTRPVEPMRKIAELADDWLEKAIEIAPPQWVDGLDIKPTITFWKTQRKTRCNAALEML